MGNQRETTKYPLLLKAREVERVFGIPRSVVYNANRKNPRTDFPRPLKMAGGLYVESAAVLRYIETHRQAQGQT